MKTSNATEILMKRYLGGHCIRTSKVWAMLQYYRFINRLMVKMLRGIC